MAPIRCPNAPSAARSFLRLANRSCSFSTLTASKSAAPLDFLVPRSTASKSAIQGLRKSMWEADSTFLHQARRTKQSVAIRSFSVSTSRRATVCVHNPVKDEDGKEMMLEITPRAAKRLAQIAAKDKNPNLALRISVESGGCHGFQYLMSLITIPEGEVADTADAEGSVVTEEDTIFQFKAEEEGADAAAAARVVLDEPSLDLLKGSKVDFTQELIGSQFKIVDNPYATSSCGCGTSFDIKM